MVMKIQQLIDEKGHDILSVTPDTSVYDAVKLMADNNVGALLAMDGTKLVGIFSERDYARKIILKGRASSETSIADVMSKNVVCAKPSQTVEECMALMTDKTIRHLPVLNDGKVVGIISIGDLVKSVIRDQQFVIEQLEHYLHA